MWLQSSRLHLHATAKPGSGTCGNCGNEVEYELVWAKAGLGLGVPVVMWFTDRFTITTHKNYFIGCPVCGDMTKIPAQVAHGFIREAD